MLSRLHEGLDMGVITYTYVDLHAESSLYAGVDEPHHDYFKGCGSAAGP
jgi:hypothetical protein